MSRERSWSVSELSASYKLIFSFCLIHLEILFLAWHPDGGNRVIINKVNPIERLKHQPSNIDGVL